MAGVFVTLLIALVTGLLWTLAARARDREAKWERAIKLARIASDPEASELLKEIARLGLADLRLPTSATPARRILNRVPLVGEIALAFDPLPEKAEEQLVTDAAASNANHTDQELDEDIARAIRIFVAIKSGFDEKSFSLDDRRTRITFLLGLFAIAFVLVTVAASIRALAPVYL